MADKTPRRDPYRNFNFRVLIGGALVVLAGVVIAKIASAARTERDD